jgi:hypothetical protein
MHSSSKKKMERLGLIEVSPRNTLFEHIQAILDQMIALLGSELPAYEAMENLGNSQTLEPVT